MKSGDRVSDGGTRPYRGTVHSALIEFLLQAIQPPGKVDPEALEQSLPSILDWGQLFRSEAYTYYLPLIYSRLKEFHLLDRLPEEHATLLQKAYYGTLAYNLFLKDTVEDLTASASEAGIPVMLLKGIALLYILYPNPALRPMADIDLLIPRKALKGMEALLKEKGFIRKPGGEPPHHRSYLHRSGRPLIEVHLRLQATEYSLIPFESLSPYLQTLSLGSGKVLVFPPSLQVLNALLHSAVHRFVVVHSIMDGAWLLDRYPVDWSFICRLAVQWRAAGLLYAGLLSAQDWGLPIPETLPDQLPFTSWRKRWIQSWIRKRGLLDPIALPRSLRGMLYVLITSPIQSWGWVFLRH